MGNGQTIARHNLEPGKVTSDICFDISFNVRNHNAQKFAGPQR